MKAKHKLIFLVALSIALLLAWGPPGAFGQTTPAQTPDEEAADKDEAAEKAPPPAPREMPGFFPRGLPPSPVTSLEMSSITTALGPATGVLAPYGNAAAYDTLTRGWNLHKAGPFNLAPFLEYDGIYRSNVFSTPTNKKSDFINVINPGLRIELPVAQRHKLSAGYLGNYFIWSRFSSFSHYDHNFNADAVFNLRDRLSVRLGNGLRLATEEPSAENARERPYLRNTPYFQATYSLADKWKVQGFYQFDVLDFQKSEDKINNSQEHSGGATLSYKFWPKTAALVQYLVISRTFPNAPVNDKIINAPYIGLVWDPTAKISGTVKLGYSFTSFDEKVSGRNNSPSSFSASVQTQYRYSRYTNLSLTFQRSQQDDVDFGNSAFWNTGVFVTLSHEWTYFKTTTYASFAYTNNSYINDSFDAGTGTFRRRDDNILHLGAGLSRTLTRWLRLRLDYTYINNSSNFSGFTYNDHRFLIGLQTSI